MIFQIFNENKLSINVIAFDVRFSISLKFIIARCFEKIYWLIKIDTARLIHELKMTRFKLETSNEYVKYNIISQKTYNQSIASRLSQHNIKEIFSNV